MRTMDLLYAHLSEDELTAATAKVTTAGKYGDGGRTGKSALIVQLQGRDIQAPLLLAAAAANNMKGSGQHELGFPDLVAAIRTGRIPAMTHILDRAVQAARGRLNLEVVTR